MVMKGHYEFKFTLIRLYLDHNIMSIYFYLFYFGGDGVIKGTTF